MFRRGDHIGTKITVYSPLLMSFLYLNIKISGLNPDMFMFYFIRLLLLPMQGGNERIINLHLHTRLQRVMGKFTPVHLFAMSDAPCWQNECKFTKGKRERNASQIKLTIWVQRPKIYQKDIFTNSSVRCNAPC